MSINDNELEEIFENVENSIRLQISDEARTFGDARGLETYLFVEYDLRINNLLRERGVYLHPDDKTDPIVTKIDFRKNEFLSQLSNELLS